LGKSHVDLTKSTQAAPGFTRQAVEVQLGRALSTIAFGPTGESEFSHFDRRRYPTVSMREGYRERPRCRYAPMPTKPAPSRRSVEGAGTVPVSENAALKGP
jgi:hypothetical protein